MYKEDKQKIIVASIIASVLFGYYFIFGKDKILNALAVIGLLAWVGTMFLLNKSRKKRLNSDENQEHPSQKS